MTSRDDAASPDDRMSLTAGDAQSSRTDAPAWENAAASSPGAPADYRALFDASPTPLLIVSPPDWTIVAVNDARLGLTGTTREEQVGRRLFDVFPDDPEDPDADGVRNLTASFERVVATGATDTMPVQRYAVRGPDGRFVERWWAPVNTPVLGADGAVSLIIHHVEDVTEVVHLRDDARGRDELARGQQAMIDRLRASEAALRESEARRDAALRIARLGTFEWDPTSGAVVLDTRARELFGFTPDEVLTAGQVFGRAHPDDLPGVRAAAHGAADTAEPLTIDYRITLPDGTARILTSLGGPVLDAEGRTERMVGVFADATERSRAEAALRESEARFRTMADRAPVMMWVTDATGSCIHLNARWYEFTGQEPGAGEGYGWLDAVHPDDRAAAEQAFVSATANRRDYRVEFRLRRADGTYRWTIDDAAARFGPDGEFMGFVGSVIDIDERREVEQALAASRATLRAVYDNTPAGLIVAELPSGRLVEANRTLERIFRHQMHHTDSADEYGVWESYGADGRRTEAHEYPLARTFATGEPAEGTYHFVRGDGTRAWLRVQTAPIRDGARMMTGGVVAVTDVDEMVRTRDALERLTAGLEAQVAERTAELRLHRDMIQSDASPILAFDRDYRVIAFNRAHDDEFRRVFGREARIGEVLPDLFPPDQAATLTAMMTRALAGESFTVVEEFGDPNLAKPYFEVSYHPLRDETGRVVGAFHHAKDISDRLRTEVELAAAQDALRQSQKMESLGQLTGGVALDFNNLLTVIRSSADLLRRHELPDEKRRRYIDAIADTADRAARLTAQLLAFSRRSALKAEVFDAAARVTGIADMIRTVIGSRVALSIDTACPDCFVEADATQFETALVNVVVNARDAMEGEGRLSVTIDTVDALPPTRGHAGTRGAFVAVSVTDTGAGIAPEHLERIFEPFYTTKDIGKGTGLGLSQVFGFAKQSGGEIDVRSQVGEGTTFTLYLPRADAARAAAAPIRDHARAEGQGRVLVVEDNVQVGEFAAQLLDDLGYRTTLAPNAADALDLLEADAGAFDIVFSDVVMPGMGGVELGRRLRERWPALPVVLTSGYSHVLAEDARHGFPLLHKPYSVEDLARILGRTIAEAG